MTKLIPLPIFLVLAYCLISTVGLSAFYTRGEAREALIVQEIASTGNYVLPRGYNNSLPSKPPLFHWLGSFTSKLFWGPSPFSIRLTSTLFALLALVFFLHELKDELNINARIAFLIILSFSFEWLRSSTSGRVDMVHASSLACGLLTTYKAISTRTLTYWFLSVIFISLSILGKGPVAAVIPALVFTAYVSFGVDDSRKQKLRNLSLVYLCIAVSLALASIWYIEAYLTAPKEFFDKFWYENVARFDGTIHDQPHNHSALFLYLMLFVGFLPWSPFLVWQIFKYRPKSFSDLKNKWASFLSIEKFSLIALLTIVIFYSIPLSKRGVYLLAAYPFLAFLTVRLFKDKIEFNQNKLIKIFAACTLILVIAQSIIIPIFYAPKSDERKIVKTLSEIQGVNTVFSFGQEFYAASFYSGKRFFRLEDQIDQITQTAPASGNNTVLIVKDNDLAEVTSLLDQRDVDLTPYKHVELGKNKVNLIFINKRKIRTKI